MDALQPRMRINTGNSGFYAFRWNVNVVYVLCNVICMPSSAEVSTGNGVTIPTRGGGGDCLWGKPEQCMPSCVRIMAALGEIVCILRWGT